MRLLVTTWEQQEDQIQDIKEERVLKNFIVQEIKIHQNITSCVNLA